jgi:hypothetical protein
MKRWERRRKDTDDDGRDEEVPVARGDTLGRRPRRPPHGGGTVARPHRGPGRSARGGHGGKRILWNSPPAHSDVILSSVSSDTTFCRSLFLCQCQCRCSCLPVRDHPPLPRLSGALAASSLSLLSAAALAAAAAAAEDTGLQRLAVVRGGEVVHARQ